MKKSLTVLVFVVISKIIFSSTNWTIIFIGQPIDLKALHFVNDNIGFVVANGYFLKTTNGGANWIITSSRYNLQKVYFLNTQTGYTVGKSNDSGFVLKTTNGGGNWNNYFLGTIGSNFEYGNISFKNENTGYIVYPGTNGGYYRTTNAGLFWVLKYFVGEHVRDVKWVGDSLYKVGSRDAGGFLKPIYWSSTDELDWNTGMICTDCSSGERGVSLFMYDTVRYWATEQTYPLFRRSTLYFPGWLYMSGLSIPASYSFDDPKYIHYGYRNVSNTYLYSSSNSGFTWVTDTLLDFDVQGMQFASRNIGYAIGKTGLIAKTINCGGVIGITNISNEIPKNFELHQNYPNPFNPSTNIEIDIASRGNVELIVYDLLGRELTTLVNQILNPGKYKVNWNGSDYPSGIYFYSLRSGIFRQTNIMVLIK